MNKPYFYKVGYGSYEDSANIELTSYAYFPPEAFNDLILKCIPAAVKAYINKQEEYYKKISKEWQYKYCSFSDLYKFVADELITQYEFTPITYDATYSIFGWPNLSIKGDWSDTDRDPNFVAVNDIVMDVYKELGLDGNMEFDDEEEEKNDMLEL